MIRRPPGSTRTDTLFPYTTLFLSGGSGDRGGGAIVPFILAAGVEVDVRLAAHDRHRLRARRPHRDQFGAHALGDMHRLGGGAGAADEHSGRPAGGGKRQGGARGQRETRSEEHTSELQSLMRISYAVFCLKKKNKDKTSADM